MFQTQHSNKSLEDIVNNARTQKEKANASEAAREKANASEAAREKANASEAAREKANASESRHPKRNDRNSSYNNCQIEKAPLRDGNNRKLMSINDYVYFLH